MDRRSTPFSGRLALATLNGQVEAEFTEGKAATITVPLADLLVKPCGARDRQVLMGDAVTVIDQRDGHVFVQATKDGYCGWLDAAAVGGPFVATHWVAARASHLYSGPKVQVQETAALPMGARLQVTATHRNFAETPFGFVPVAHLRPQGDTLTDPVSVAETLLGAPYLWGGNSAAGIDCSGVVQAALLACGLPCPGDSDQQQALGVPIAEDQPLQRGDLLFWKGHVAMVVDDQRIIHANGQTMTVAYEGIDDAIARIVAQGGGPVTARRRLQTD